MGKRQIRIAGTRLQQHAPELLEQSAVQVVLRSRVVLAGKLLQVSPDNITVLDMRRSKHVLPTDQIQEVIYDIEAVW
ncbi:hypothetical protein H8S95_15215 [Pontibacter sp. KCTC 32443]|uniref:hypothetical protein n=1 Tax=Pontibacter TaxID=323449 RepID=UPI00164D8C28|nr:MULTISPECIES: hypothetical protein [Pontibacter]MBC5775428.1 hypothetical protein [Pontibacter sp. KCTC 32443]